MTKAVITINGKTVYSDKRIADINNTKVTFSDGSWCDVATGMVVNKGIGSISIGSPEGSDEERTTRGPEAFVAKDLNICNLIADVEIVAIDGDQMTVTIEGPSSEVEAIEVKQNGDTLNISSKTGGSGYFGSNIVSSGNLSISVGDISIGRGSFNISTRGEGETKIKIGLPKGSGINVSDIMGDVQIGDIEGPLTATASASNKITAGRIGSAVLSASSGGKIIVQSVNGSLTTNASSGAKITVKDGVVHNLTASVSSGATITFSGNAVNAQLKASSGGQINVKHVDNKPQSSVSSGGSVNVDNW